MSYHHPSSDLIKRFVSGSLDSTLASIVSAHVEHCSQCAKAVSGFEQTSSIEAFSSPLVVAAPEMADAWTKISSRLVTTDNSFAKDQAEIEIFGLKFELPRALKSLVTNPIKWMPFGKGGMISKLGQEHGKSLFLIYLPANEQVPIHSHAGMEYSYVISGSYSADGLEFNTGDFSSSSETVVHAPKAGSDDGCLLLSSVENRLNFFQGWLRPFNRLLWWFLNVRIRWMV